MPRESTVKSEENAHERRGSWAFIMAVKRQGKFKNAAAKAENGVKRGLILAANLVAQRATGKAPRDTGRLKRSITRGDPKPTGKNRWGIDVGTNVIYAAAQEFGFTGVITDKQRRFFWAKSADTGNPMWRALALSTEYTIPAHPYLNPALDESKREIATIILRSVVGALRKK